MSLSHIQKNLIRRYLLWAYKSTRESFERIERKTTQLMVDHHILKTLSKQKKIDNSDYQKQISEFNEYIAKKRQDELLQKFSNSNKKTLHPQYLYLKNRLEAIEIAIVDLLGKSELKKFELMFEQEFTQRILQSKDH